ncbi:MAG: hypothetical protein ACRD3J_18765 [Thermoanaerobaculia bacterium]
MTLYRSLGNRIGTAEAVNLAHRLAVWHDAMVVHQRRAATESCEIDCPHREAESLWLEALETYGERAYQLAFLRNRGMRAAPVRHYRSAETEVA